MARRLGPCMGAVPPQCGATRVPVGRGARPSVQGLPAPTRRRKPRRGNHLGRRFRHWGSGRGTRLRERTTGHPVRRLVPGMTGADGRALWAMVPLAPPSRLRNSGWQIACRRMTTPSEGILAVTHLLPGPGAAALFPHSPHPRRRPRLARRVGLHAPAAFALSIRPAVQGSSAGVPRIGHGPASFGRGDPVRALRQSSGRWRSPMSHGAMGAKPVTGCGARASPMQRW